VNQGERCLDFVTRYGNLVVMIAIVTIAAASLLGVGNSSIAELFSLEAWLRAAGSFLRKL
jgi:hypothetical protein